MLAAKIGVGGTQALLEVVRSDISTDEKKAILSILFGLSDEEIEQILQEDADNN